MLGNYNKSGRVARELDTRRDGDTSDVSRCSTAAPPGNCVRRILPSQTRTLLAESYDIRYWLEKQPSTKASLHI